MKREVILACPESFPAIPSRPPSIREQESEGFRTSRNDKNRNNKEGPFKVGIFWQGSPEHKVIRNRSMPLYNFYPVCRLPNIEVYSLQKGIGVEQLKNVPQDIKIMNMGETFRDFADTAAAIMNLDLVITVDTAVGHLSGALGKKTWILMPPYAEWRWFLDMDYSPWYEDVRLFRHKEQGKRDWAEMMERVTEQVTEEIKNRR